MTIIGISGKIGSGKNYLATALMKELEARGYKTSEASFATPLKSELTGIIELTRSLVTEHNKDRDVIINSITSLYRIPVEQSEIIYDFILADILDETTPVDGYSRTEGIRRALQFLGTDVRRKMDNQYWVNRFHENLTVDGFVFVTDVRFSNEADSIIEHGGKILRLEPPAEVVAERTALRDGVNYSPDAHQHVSEIALDDYPNFDMVIATSDFDVKEIVDFLTK